MSLFLSSLVIHLSILSSPFRQRQEGQGNRRCCQDEHGQRKEHDLVSISPSDARQRPAALGVPLTPPRY
jgi:hypothetical protein